MKKINLLLASLFTLIFICTKTFAQTTTINYLTSNLSTSACNVFNPSTAVGGITHSSRAGGVTFSSSNGIRLSTYPQSFSGTAFVIQYNFTSGSTYGISIVASGGNGSITLNTSVVPNLNQFPTNSTTSCTPDANVGSYNLAGYGAKTFSVASPITTYSVPSFSVPSSQQYLIIWARGGAANLSLDGFYIRSVTITKTTADPELTLSPTSMSATCGVSQTQTFTVSNPNNVTGITGYNWNLGTTPNGWLYGGSAAPQTISTTTNSLTLTTVCGSIPKNVSVNVMKGAVVYKTYTSVVSNTQQSYSISGSEGFCTATGTYSVTPALCNATYSWVSSNTSAASVSANGNTATLTKTGGGTTTLTATISNGCTGGNITVTKTITVGTPSVSIAYSPSGSCNGTYQTWYLNATAPGPVSTWLWTVDNPSSGSWNIFNASSPYTYVSVSGGGGISVSATNSCGTTKTGVTIWSNCNGLNAITVSPNPATSDVKVSLAETAETATVTKKKAIIYRIHVMDQSGNMKKQLTYAAGAGNVSVNLNGLTPGIYTIRAFDGTMWRNAQFIKK